MYGAQFQEFEEAEVLRQPVGKEPSHTRTHASLTLTCSFAHLADGMILQMKRMGISAVERFPFPSPPPRESLAAAVRMLVRIGALHRVTVRDANSGKLRQDERLTALGDILARLPLQPRLAKMIVLGRYTCDVDVNNVQCGACLANTHAWYVWSRDSGCFDHVVAMVAALSVHEPFIRPRVAKPQKAAAGATRASSSAADGNDSDVSFEEVYESDSERDDDALSPEEAAIKAAAAAAKSKGVGTVVWETTTTATRLTIILAGSFPLPVYRGGQGGAGGQCCSSGTRHVGTPSE